MIFDVNKFANGIGKAIGETGKINGEELGKRIRQSLDIAVSEVNDNINRGIKQMRAAHGNLKNYVSELEEKAADLKGDFENLKAQNKKHIEARVQETKEVLNDVRADMIARGTEIADDAEKRLVGIKDELQGDLNKLLEKWKAEVGIFQDQIKIKLEETIDELKESLDRVVSENIEKHGDKIADLILWKLIPAFFRTLKRLILRR